MAVVSPRTIRAGLAAALDLLTSKRQEHIDARVTHNHIRPFDRAIAGVRRAIEAIPSALPRRRAAPPVSSDLAVLIRKADEAETAHEAASDRLDTALARLRERCPRPELPTEYEHQNAELAQMINGDDFFIAADRARIAEYLRLYSQAEAELGIAAMESEYEAAGRAWQAAEEGVLAHRARSIADVVAKMQFAARAVICTDDFMAVVTSDLSRVASKKGSP
jgi:hypothetical protein